MDYFKIQRIRNDLPSEGIMPIDIDIEMNRVEVDTNELSLILVIDTNIFISNLTQLEVKSNKYKENILFSVPWVVLQELDRLKSRDRATVSSVERISFKATKAIQFIHSILSSKTNNFIFENSIQVFFYRLSNNEKNINSIVYFFICFFLRTKQTRIL